MQEARPSAGRSLSLRPRSNGSTGPPLSSTKAANHVVGMTQAVRTSLHPKNGPKAPTLGPQPMLVLASLGFVMRSFYDHVVQEPLPSELQSLVQQLPDAGDRDPAWT